MLARLVFNILRAFDVVPVVTESLVMNIAGQVLTFLGLMHVIAQPDLHTKMSEEGVIQYSGVYFTIFSDQSGQICGMREEGVPQRIYSSKVDFGWEGEIRLDLKDVSLIYENGVFCGPSIADEDNLEF